VSADPQTRVESLEAEAVERNHRAFMRHGKLPSKYWVVRDGKLCQVWRTKEPADAAVR
jgi:hypothetical protein